MPYIGTRFYGISTNTFAAGRAHMAVDHSRGVAYYADSGISLGESILKWSGTAAAATDFALSTETMVSVTGIGWNSVLDELLVTEEGQGGGTQQFMRIDATDGAILSTGTYSYPSTDSQVIQGRGRFYFDPVLEHWWGLGVGVANGFIYVSRLIPTGATFAGSVAGTGVPLVNDNINRAPLIDNAGTVWIVTSAYVVKCDASAPESFAHSATLDPEASFIWKARNEIWVPRSSDHGTLGYRVFNIGSETFANSVDLGIGTWTTVAAKGVENGAGHAWQFESAGGNVINGSLRNTSGTQVRSFAALWVEPNTMESLRYTSGKVFVENAGTLRAVLE